MQLDLPDPEYTGSERARANFRLAFRLAAWGVGILWVVYLVDWALGLELARFGIRPRQPGGLIGILAAPLIHGSFRHLLDNSLPLLVLCTLLLYLYPGSALKVLPAVYVGTGLAVWLLARPSVHIGASGLVYGLAAYVFVAGLLRRDARAMVASLAVFFLYGTLVWGVLPIERGVSWETHLAAAVIGLVMAVRYRRLDQPPRKRYSWEDEDEDGGAGSAPGG